MSTKAQREAVKKYDRTNTRQIILKLNLTGDADILMKLDEVDNRQGYIKQLIRTDIRGTDTILTTDAIRTLIRPAAKKFGLKKVFLFGSYARGDAAADSDIDLMIDGGNSVSYHDYQRLVDAFRSALNKEVDVVEYAAVQKDRTRSGQRFLEHFERDKVLIYE